METLAVVQFCRESSLLIFKVGEIGGACSIHGGDEKCVQNFGQKT
jgi:hypothetical protein